MVNENLEKTEDAMAKTISQADIDDAEARLARFCTFLNEEIS